MSVRWISFVWESSPYEGRRLLLHLALADFANDDGSCFPSQKTLALKARTTETWVSASVRQMINDGLLEIIEKGNGRGNRTIYQLHKGTTQKGLTEKGETSGEQSPNVEHLYLYKNRKEPSKDLSSEFEQFWNKYPRRVAKVAARNVFLSVMLKPNAPSLVTLLTAVDKYAKTEIDKKYIAHPATWLRQGRWEDDSEECTTTPAVKDWHLDQALDRVVPFAHQRKSWEDCLDLISLFEPRVIEPCKKIYDEIRAQQ